MMIPARPGSFWRWSGSFSAFRRRLGGVAARRSGPDFWRRLVELRPDPAGPYDRGDLRLRRQRPDRDLALCPAANFARALAGPGEPLVRAAWLQFVLRACRHWLPDRHYPVEGICRAGVVCRHLARGRMGRVLPDLSEDARAAQGAAHLRFELVLHGL